MEKIREIVERRISGRVFGTILFLAVVCIALFAFRDRYFNAGRAADEKLRSLDVFRPAYYPDEILAFLSWLNTQNKLVFYGVSELTLDLVFPVLYVGFFLFIIVRAFGPSAARVLILFPLAAGVLDVFENSLIAYMSFSFDGSLPRVSPVVFILTYAKWTAAAISGIASIAGVTLAVIRRPARRQ